MFCCVSVVFMCEWKAQTNTHTHTQADGNPAHICVTLIKHLRVLQPLLLHLRHHLFFHRCFLLCVVFDFLASFLLSLAAFLRLCLSVGFFSLLLISLMSLTWPSLTCLSLFESVCSSHLLGFAPEKRDGIAKIKQKPLCK